jgi:hypothetical protein
MLTGFLSRANISLNCPTGLSKSMTVANKHKKELKAIEKAGSGCRRQATWIGLLRYVKLFCCFVVTESISIQLIL